MLVHEAAEAFPLMDATRFAELKADIIRHGLRQAITVCDGKVLDGRNRCKACEELGIEPATVEYAGDPWAYVWSLNGQRRDLSEDVRAQIFIYVEAKSEYWKEQREKIAATANAKRSKAAKGNKNAAKDRPAYACTACDEVFEHGDLGHCGACHHHYTAGSKCKNCHQHTIKNTMKPAGFSIQEWIEKKNSDRTNCPTTVPEQERDKSKHAKATAAGVNAGAIARAEALERKRPDLAAKVRAGEIKPAEARRQAKKEEVAEKAAALPDGKFGVIYADPPWSYNDKLGGDLSGSYGGAENHYPTMSLADLKSLEIPSIAAENCVLFLWATCPLIEDALELSRAWGFKYKAQFVWDKVKHNMGHYNSVRHELLLICTKGSATPENVVLHDSVQSIEKTKKHSEKPEEFRKIIESLYPSFPKIELFRRGESIDGWHVWGNEAVSEARA